VVVAYLGRKLQVNRIVKVESYQVKEHRIVAYLGLDKYHLVVHMLVREAYCFDTQAIQSLDHKVEAYRNHDVLLLLFVLHKHHDET